MRTMSKEYHDKLRRGNSVYATILNTPRPDFTELDKECEDLKAWITEEHKKDRQVMMEALKANGSTYLMGEF